MNEPDKETLIEAAREGVNKKIVEAYLEAEADGYISFTDIGRAHGMTGTRVKQILIESGLSNPVSNAKRGRKNFTGVLPLSPIHAVIGRRVTLHRLDTPQTVYGAQVGMSSAALGLVESGHYDLTLSNIQALAAHMGVTIEELMKEKV